MYAHSINRKPEISNSEEEEEEDGIGAVESERYKGQDHLLAEGCGLTVILGIHATPQMLPIHPMELFDGRRIVASVFGGFKGRTHLPLFAKQCYQGVVKLDEFITHKLPFDEINKAFDLLVSGKSLRCLLHL